MSPQFRPITLGEDLEVAVEGVVVQTWRDGVLALAGTSFGMVTAATTLRTPVGRFELAAGMFFVEPGEATVEGGAGYAITTPWRGLRQLGGPVETTGRLRYIDGCTDTLVVAPPRLGDPCLNHLHIPAGTLQSSHTHPSLRAGVILGGRGRCVTPGGTFDLRPGMGWVIPTGLLHAFHTDDVALDVLAWHPDSDFGPTDGFHPMINRTILPGAAP